MDADGTDWLVRGLSLVDTGDAQAAHTRAIEQIKVDHRAPEPYAVLARIAEVHGNHVKAPELFERAIAQAASGAAGASGAAPFQVLAARYDQSRGDHGSAARRMATVTPDSIAAAHLADVAGVVLSRAGQHQQALPFFYRAVALDDRPDNVYFNLGASLQFLGRFDDAAAAYERCIARNPAAHRAYTALVSLQKQTEARNYVPQLRALFDDQVEAEERLHLGHALAKTYEDIGDYPASLAWLSSAKKAKRASLDYSIDDDLVLFDAARETLTALPSSPVSGAQQTPSPVFVVGLPRTGTTLVDRILSSHPQVVSVGEQNAFAAGIKSLAGTHSRQVLDAETLAAVRDADLSPLSAEYLSSVAHLVEKAPRLVDKMPLNFFYVALLLRAFPNARVVALRRHPLDSCLSNYRQLFSTGFSYYNYSLSLEDTGRYYRGFDALMGDFRRSLPASRFAEFWYEDFVFAQETTTRELLSFCDLAWDDACLSFHENTAPVATASSVQVRSPIYRGSVGRWRRYGGTIDGLVAQLTDLLPESGHIGPRHSLHPDPT